MEEKEKSVREDESVMEAIKKMTGNNATFMNLDDTFEFNCKQCGKCCMNREDIILNPFDIYNGAKYLGITCEEFLMRYTTIQLGGHSKIPIVLLAQDERGMCPLLKFDIKDGGKFKCSIHEAKPGVCANHPIGVVRGRKNSKIDADVNFIKVDQCPNSMIDAKPQVIKDWVAKYIANQEDITFGHDMQTMVTDYFDSRAFWFVINELKHNAKECVKENKNADTLVHTMDELLKGYMINVIGSTYANYDTSRPFKEQAIENKASLHDFYEATKTIFEHLSELYEAASGTSVKDALAEFTKQEEEEE